MELPKVKDKSGKKFGIIATYKFYTGLTSVVQMWFKKESNRNSVFTRLDSGGVKVKDKPYTGFTVKKVRR